MGLAFDSKDIIMLHSGTGKYIAGTIVFLAVGLITCGIALGMTMLRGCGL